MAENIEVRAEDISEYIYKVAAGEHIYLEPSRIIRAKMLRELCVIESYAENYLRAGLVGFMKDNVDSTGIELVAAAIEYSLIIRITAAFHWAGTDEGGTFWDEFRVDLERRLMEIK